MNVQLEFGVSWSFSVCWQSGVTFHLTLTVSRSPADARAPWWPTKAAWTVLNFFPGWLSFPQITWHEPLGQVSHRWVPLDVVLGTKGY